MDISIINPIAATPDLTASSLVHPASSSRPVPPAALREVNIVELGAAIADLGHRATVVLGSAYVGNEPIPLGPNLSVVPVHTLMPFPFHPGLLPMTPELLRHPATRDADVIQSGEFHQPSTFFGAGASLEHEIPFVLWQETFAPMRFPGSLYQRGFEMACGPRIRAAATRCVPRTTKARDYLRGLGFAEDSISAWIPTGVDLTQFGPRPSGATPEEFGWRDECDILLLVARLSPSKGVDRALRILKRLQGRRRGARLLVRGSGPQEAELRQLANRLGISEFVRFVPKRTRAQMVDLYNLAKVVLCTSRSDLLPFAVMEAGACGRPVVATDVGAVTDIVVEGRTGRVVPAEDEQGFCDAVAATLEQDDEREAYGRAARARAEACFDVRSTARHLVEVYHASAS
jgi:glycosyltransferase involved in cell wall biosynthesis